MDDITYNNVNALSEGRGASPQMYCRSGVTQRQEAGFGSEASGCKHWWVCNLLALGSWTLSPSSVSCGQGHGEDPRTEAPEQRVWEAEAGVFHPLRGPRQYT